MQAGRAQVSVSRSRDRQAQWQRSVPAGLRYPANLALCAAAYRTTGLKGGACRTGCHEQHEPTDSYKRFKGLHMNMTLSLAPIVSLIAGILILVVPRLLNFIVAIYLITIGLLGLLAANGVQV